MKNIAIIPARSGSKGLKDKNIKELYGKPLLAYTIDAAEKSEIFDEIFVSTDSPVYADIAKQYGANVPFLRDSSLAQADTGTWEVILDSLDKYEKMGKNFDTVTLLQPTSPLRTFEDIKQGFQLFNEKKAVSVIGVCELAHSPLRSNILPPDNCLKTFFTGNNAILPRQKLPTYYRINGALYIVTIEKLRESLDNLYSEHSYAYIMEKEHSIDIDDELDFIMTKAIMGKSLK